MITYDNSLFARAESSEAMLNSIKYLILDYMAPNELMEYMELNHDDFLRNQYKKKG